MSPPVFQSHARKYLQENVDQFLSIIYVAMLPCWNHKNRNRKKTKYQTKKIKKKNRPPQNKINNNNKIKKAKKKPNEEN